MLSLMSSFTLADLEDGKAHPCKIEASEAELESVRNRIKPADISALSAELQIKHDQHRRVYVQGRLTAKLIQDCGKTLERVAHTLRVPIEECLIYPDQLPDDDRDPEEEKLPDYEVLDNAESLDLGEYLIQHLILSIDPYFVKEGEAMDHTEHGRQNPFEALQGLTRKD